MRIAPNDAFEGVSNTWDKREQLLSCVLDFTPACMFVHGLDHRYLLVNSEWERVSGRSREEVIGKHPDQIWNQSTSATFLRTSHLVMESRKPVSLEDSIDTAGGRRLFLTTKFPLFDENGEVCAVGGIAIDVTEERKARADLSQAHSQLASIVSSAPVAILTHTMDGTITSWNPAAEEIFGWSSDEVVGSIRPSGPQKLSSEIDQSRDELLAGKSIRGRDLSCDHKSGAGLELCLSRSLLRDSEGRAAGFLSILQDLTEERRSLATLKEAELKLRLAFESMDDGLLFEDAHGRILVANTSAQRLLGMSESELVGHTCTEIPWTLLQEDGQEWEPGSHPFAVAICERRSVRGIVVGVQRPGEAVLWLSVNAAPVITDPNAGPSGILITFVDITDQLWMEKQVSAAITHVNDYQGQLEETALALAAANAELETLANTDGLTGIKNHRCFQERLAEEVESARCRRASMALLLIDVDHFKQYNDSFGHPAGDDVLRRVARILTASVRDGDFVARYGGEEFAIVLPSAEETSAIRVAERLCGAIQSADWKLRSVTVSVGIATILASESITPSDLIAHADTALYAAKSAGRNRSLSYRTLRRSKAKAHAHRRGDLLLLSKPIGALAPGMFVIESCTGDRAEISALDSAVMENGRPSGIRISIPIALLADFQALVQPGKSGTKG